jgi:Arc/MetJ family transcription regulator
MGKTTIVIDDKLLEAAIRATGAKSKRQAIEEGLKELVRKKNLEALRKELGIFDLDLTLAGLEKLRKEE